MDTKTDNIFKQVNAKADIVRVVSYYLGQNNVVKKGSRHLALCPFHNDTHPSMTLTEGKNTYKCFACGAGGDAISFVQEYAHLQPMDALKKVCEICSIPLPEQLKGPVKVDYLTKNFGEELKALETLSEFYSLSLKSKDGEEALAYLKNRGIDDKIISHFSIGFAPSDPSKSIEMLRKKGFDVSVLETAGILANSYDFKDRYASRIMFPIKDHKGRVVGFSGRKYLKDQSGGKYINYPETKLFEKSSLLYHYDSAKATAKQEGKIYVVEGFMDVIACYRAGINSAVGAMGTALTDRHVEMLKQLNVPIRLCFDSDEPGQTADSKAAQTLFANGVIPSIVYKFDDGKDCDEVLTKHGKDVLLKQLNRVYDPFIFNFASALKGRKKMTDTNEVYEFLSKNYQYFFALNEVHKAKDLAIVEKKTDLAVQTLQKQLDELQKTGKYIPEKTVEEKKEEKQQTSKPDYSRKYGNRKTERVRTNSVTPANEAIKDEATNRRELLDYLDSLDKEALGKYFDEYGFAKINERQYALIHEFPRSYEAYHAYCSRGKIFTQKILRVYEMLVGEVYTQRDSKDRNLPFKDEEYQYVINKLQNSAADESLDDDLLAEFGFEISDSGSEDVSSLSDSEKNLLISLFTNQRNAVINGASSTYVANEYNDQLSAYDKQLEAYNICRIANDNGKELTGEEISKIWTALSY